MIHADERAPSGGRTAWLPLLAILLLAATLRTVNITQQSIWFDEAFAWSIVIQDDMFPRIAADTHPPLYYVLLRAWMQIAGDSPLALRYLSALTSLMTVALLYRVAGEMVRGSPELRYVPLLAALLLALSDAEIFLAQEARNYSLYTFFACLSMWGYLRWLRLRSAGAALWWAGGTAALVYTHYQGLFIPAVQGLHALLILRGRVRWQAVGVLALSALPVLPWFVGVTIPQARNAIDNSLPFAIPSNWDTLLHLRDSYLGAQWPLMLVLAGAGLWGLWRAPRRGLALIAALWFAIPFGVLFFGNYFASLLTERKLLIVAPAIALMIGAGLGRLGNPARLLVVTAILVYGLTSVDYYRVKEPWDRIAAQAVQYAQPYDLALVEAGVGQYPMKYYWERWMPEGAIFSTLPFLADDTMAVTRDPETYYQLWLPQLYEINQTQRPGEVATAWLVFWSPDRRIINELESAGYQRTMTAATDHLGNRIDLYRYDVLPEEPRATFDNGMTLRAAEIDEAAMRVDLWWSYEPADTPTDYITSVLLLNADGVLAAQFDGPPFYGQRPTSSWTPGDVVFDPKALEPVLTDSLDELPPGDYTVVAQVYAWSPEGIAQALTIDGERWAVLGSITR